MENIYSLFFVVIIHSIMAPLVAICFVQNKTKQEKSVSYSCLRRQQQFLCIKKRYLFPVCFTIRHVSSFCFWYCRHCYYSVQPASHKKNWSADVFFLHWHLIYYICSIHIHVKIMLFERTMDHFFSHYYYSLSVSLFLLINLNSRRISSAIFK